MVLMQMRYPESPTPSVSSHYLFPQSIRRIRESAKLVVSLPPDLQRAARDSYAIALRVVFTMAMCSTLMAYIVRLAVSFIRLPSCPSSADSELAQIPDKSLDEPEPAEPSPQVPQHHHAQGDIENALSSTTSPLETPIDSEDEDHDERTPILRTRGSKPNLKRPRRLSGYESVDGVMDLESDVIGGSARRK